MNKLGENIKRNRKNKKMTQEQLASVLGVSEQAVSRWENGTTYPDIELLPTIAMYFEVSMDELMGMEAYRDEKPIEAIKEQCVEFGRQGRIRECIEVLKKAVKHYPRSYELWAILVHNLTFENLSGEDEIRNLNQALEIIDRILAECIDYVICNRMRTEKIWVLKRLGKAEEAIKLAEQEPSLWASNELLLPGMYSGDRKRERCRETLQNLCGAMTLTIFQLADAEDEDKSLSIRDRINILKKAIEVYELVYEGNYAYNSVYLSQYHRQIAALEIEEGNRDSAMEHLEMAAEYALEFDLLPEKVPYSSLLLHGSQYENTLTSKNYAWSECEGLLEKLKHKRYEPVRDNERFCAIEKTLKNAVKGT